MAPEGCGPNRSNHLRVCSRLNTWTQANEDEECYFGDQVETEQKPDAAKTYSGFTATHFLPAYSLYPAPSSTNFSGTGRFNSASV